MPKLLRLLLSVFAVLSLGVALAACGDDDDSDDTGDTTTTEAAGEATDEGEEASAPLCAEGDASIFPPSVEPSADADPVNVSVTEEGEGTDRTYAFSENAATDLGEIGSYAVTFQNTGEEMHELIVSRINDDETRTVPELLAALAQGTDPTSFSKDVATTSACPGEETVVGVNITEPGRYVLVCAFPVGATPGITEAELPQGPPHAAKGMVNEITVS